MLSTTSVHALRALAGLAALASDHGPVLARDLSAGTGVPVTYLSKILSSLSRAGILRANRGPKGGYRLARAAEAIPLLDVVELFEGVKDRPDCLFAGAGKCSDDNPCSAHGAFKRVREVYLDFLKTTTIADIAGRGRPDGDLVGQRVPR